ncbi:MAG: ATP-binding cassette domain-containing protein [Ignavibacteria bacterium]|nr:ATP-binding cassette domain-containing protein [Ignavibacteria bacterium]
MNILFGIHKPDSGYLKVFGTEVSFKSPLDAIENNIGMVHQHFMLIDDFTVLENVILGDEITKSKGLSIDFKKAGIVLNEIIDKYDLGLDVNRLISEISIGQQQKVEILKLLYRRSEILIFDEPTAVLSPVEVEHFFKIINSFKADGKTIIFITHKLNEVKHISDRVSVLRKSKLVYESDNSNELNISDLSKAIVGDINDIQNSEKRNASVKNVEALKLDDISLTVNEVKILNSLDLTLMKGEIHGICGVEGNGQSELVDVIYGLQKNFEGNYKKLIPGGISLVPDDRKRKGFIKEFNIGENISLKGANLNFLPSKKINKISEKIISDNDVRVSDLESPMSELSGGNQQKVIFARETDSGTDSETDSENNILILVHPTRGVDINATAFIHSKIISQRNEGKAVLLISSDLDELISLSDRLSVLYKGEILKTFNRDEFSRFIKSDSEIEPETDPEFLLMLGKLMTGINDK